MKKVLLQKAAQVLRIDEGERLQAYKDSKGLWTIGVGRLIESIEKLVISKQASELFLFEDIEKHWQEAERIFGAEFLDSVEDARCIAILSLAFTLGGEKLKGFKNTIAAIKARDWEKAAEGIKASKWAKDVDPKQREGAGRDDRIAHMLKEGTFPRYYGIL